MEAEWEQGQLANEYSPSNFRAEKGNQLTSLGGEGGGISSRFFAASFPNCVTIIYPFLNLGQSVSLEIIQWCIFHVCRQTNIFLSFQKSSKYLYNFQRVRVAVYIIRRSLVFTAA